MRRTQVESFVAEIYEEIFQPGVFVFCIAQVAGIEVDVSENT